MRVVDCVYIYIDDKWCNNKNIIDKYCDENIELLAISVRPFYLPCELNNIFVINVYTPPDEVSSY